MSHHEHEAFHRLADFLTELEIEEVDMPHIVLCRRPDNLYPASFSGPYATVVEALVAADYEQRQEQTRDGARSLTFTVAPLYPGLMPSGPGTTSPNAL